MCCYFKKLQQIYFRLVNMIRFPVCLLTNQGTIKNLNITLSFYPPFEPTTTNLLNQPCPFYIYRSVCWAKCVIYIYIHSLCTRAEKALASLCICTDSPESSLFHCAISTEIAFAVTRTSLRILKLSPEPWLVETRLAPVAKLINYSSLKIFFIDSLI